jgi:hypothetical protein
MRRKLLARTLTVILVLAILISDIQAAPLGSGVGRVQAAPPIWNAIVGLFRVGTAMKKRNAVYTEAGVTANDINTYYDGLIEHARTARQEIFSRAAAGERLTLARSYIRTEAALDAERKAAIRMIEAEKNQARKDFERTLSKFIANILISSPGGQNIINKIRGAIREARQAAVAVQAALEGGKPIEALGNALASKAGDLVVAQELARGLGSAAGSKIDRALGGVGSRIEGMIGNLQASVGEGIDLLDNLDAEVAVHDNRERQPVSLVEDHSMIKEVFTVDRANPVVDVVASAFAGGAALSGSLEPGTTRGAMRDRIRGALLDGKITRIQSIASRNSVGTTYCVAVGRGEYEAATGQLGQAVQEAEVPEEAAYLVCYDNQNGLPVFTRLIEEKEKASTEETITTEGPVVAGDIPVGTYMGTGEWFAEKRKTFTESMTNKIIITVNKDGSVSGSLSAHMIEITTHNDVENCSAHWEHTGNGTFSGQLTGPNGIIENTETWTMNVYTDCPDRGMPGSVTFTQLIDVEVSGDLITGTTRGLPDDPDGLWMYTLTATKQ